jgi:hypothetical protein
MSLAARNAPDPNDARVVGALAAHPWPAHQSEAILFHHSERLKELTICMLTPIRNTAAPTS